MATINFPTAHPSRALTIVGALLVVAIGALSVVAFVDFGSGSSVRAGQSELVPSTAAIDGHPNPMSYIFSDEAGRALEGIVPSTAVTDGHPNPMSYIFSDEAGRALEGIVPGTG